VTTIITAITVVCLWGLTIHFFAVTWLAAKGKLKKDHYYYRNFVNFAGHENEGSIRVAYWAISWFLGLCSVWASVEFFKLIF